MSGRKVSQNTEASSLAATDAFLVARDSGDYNYKASPATMRKLLVGNMANGDALTFAHSETPYSTGTIGIAANASGSVVTLTGGTWPSWAADGDLIVGGELYSVLSRTSDTEIRLDNVAVTVSTGTSYSIQKADLVPQNPRWKVLPATSYTAAIPTFPVSGVSYTKTITAITDATPAVVTTSANHGLKTGQSIVISGCDVTEFNGNWVIKKITDTTFSLDDTTTATAPSAATTGTVTHDQVVTLDVSGSLRKSHGLRSGTHVTISGVLGATQVNGTWTIDAGTNDITNKTLESGGTRIVITTLFAHGYSTGDKIRVESIEKNILTESDNTWVITVLTSTTFRLDTTVATGAASVYATAYDKGGICSYAEKFRIVDQAWSALGSYYAGDIVILNRVRYVCILANSQIKPPNATYWTVITSAAYTSAGTVNRPGFITIALSGSLTVTSNSTVRRAATAAAALKGWSVGLPIRITTSSQTVYGLIVGVPGTEGFPYTDPAPLPFYLDNELHYAGPPLLAAITEIAVGTQDMVGQKVMPCTELPFYGATSELPLIPVAGRQGEFTTSQGGGSVFGKYGRSYIRWDEPDAYCVAFAIQQRTAAVNGEGEFGTGSGTSVIVPDVLRQGTFTSAIDIGTASWSGATAYVVGNVVNVGNIAYYCIQNHTNFTPPNTTYWRETVQTITPLAWNSGTAYVIGNIAVQDGTLYRSILAGTNQQPPNATYWEQATRASYTDGSNYPGSLVTRSSGNFTEGNPDTGIAGWEFTAGGIKTYIRESISANSFIVENTEMTAGTVNWFMGNYLLSPKINLIIGGVLLGTNDDHSGFRASRYDNNAVWNPASEINPQIYDVVYNSRLEIAQTGIGNRPGRSTTDVDSVYSDGTISISAGVVTLVGGVWPTWAANAYLTYQNSPSVLEVTTRTSDTELVLSNPTINAAALTKTISTTSNTTPIVVTTTTYHGLSTGQYVVITGNSAANGTWVVTKISATQFSLNGSTANGVVASGTVTFRSYQLVPGGNPAAYPTVFMTFVRK